MTFDVFVAVTNLTNCVSISVHELKGLRPAEGQVSSRSNEAIKHDWLAPLRWCKVSWWMTAFDLFWWLCILRVIAKFSNNLNVLFCRKSATCDVSRWHYNIWVIGTSSQFCHTWYIYVWQLGARHLVLVLPTHSSTCELLIPLSIGSAIVSCHA